MKPETRAMQAAIILSAAFLAADLYASQPRVVSAQGPNLEQALRETGWSVDRLVDGSLKVRLSRDTPPAPAAPPQPEIIAAPLTEAAAWERLRARGWRVEKSADGSLLLYPETGKTSRPVEKTGPRAPSPGAGEPQGTDRRPRKVSGTGEGIEALLRQRGWRAERTSDGSLLVYPLAGAKPSP